MKLFEILVPTVSNEGKPFRTAHHRVWDKKVQQISGGGITVFQPTIKGKWIDKDTGTEYTDRTIPVRIMCEQSDIEKIADWTASHYKQLAVMYYAVSDNVKITEYDCSFKRK